MSQLPLLPFQNPLASRLGPEFFRQLPRTPGVYVMYGLAGSVLYVGKAKNLRARLASYHRARPHQVSRKVIRLIHVIDEIRIETCETEAAALLRENELIRTLKPSFNVVNTSPESYYFVGLRERTSAHGHWLDFRLTTSPKFDPDWSSVHQGEFFGAFKGRGSVRDAYQTLLRILWASQTEADRFEYPGCLVSRKVPYQYSMQLAASTTEPQARALGSLLRRFFRGTSDGLLPHLTDGLLANGHIPPFFYRAIQEDLERLRGFYEFGPTRNRRIRKELGIVDPLIPQERIDDYLVMYKDRRKLRF